MTIQSDLSVQALSQTIKALRLARGDSQAAAAARVGISRRSWQRLESGDPAAAGSVALGDAVAALQIYGLALIDLVAPAAVAAEQAAGDRQRGRYAPRKVRQVAPNTRAKACT